jgi:P-aminobenzoate N-oxygenase AurF
MSTQRIYALPVEVTEWKFDGASEIQFNWEYDDGSAALLGLYEKGKKQQWDASTRLDWSLELNPDNPMELKDEAISIYDTDYWRKMTDKERSWLRRNLQANSISQFTHGEQGALIATAKIVATVPDMNAKFYAATQVMDEARHVEAYKRLLHEKFELAYPINPALKTLLEQTLSDRRWDMTYLGMQVLIEGLALAAFQAIRDKSGNTLAGAVNAYVMQDEARHVSFGRLALRDYYPQLSQAERDEREEFVVEALYFMRDRFNQSEVWDRLGLPASVLDDIHYNSKQMNSFRGGCSAASCPRSRTSVCGASACRRHSPRWAPWTTPRSMSSSNSPMTAGSPTTSTRRCSSRRRSRRSDKRGVLVILRPKAEGSLKRQERSLPSSRSGQALPRGSDPCDSG